MNKSIIPDHVYDIVIIGGGPAGLTAGIYASRASLRTLLTEGASSISQITVTDTIENYPGMPDGVGGFELVERFKKQALQFGLEMVSVDVTGISKTNWGNTNGWKVTSADRTYEAIAVIVATGANWRKLGVRGEDTFAGKGVSYCATCDGPIYKNRDVVVVGGGDAAIQEAVFLTRFANKVTVVHRRNRVRATKALEKKALTNSKIAFAWNSVVEEISGGDVVEKVKIRDVKSPDMRMEIPAQGVFIFIGLTPKTDLVRGILDLDADGYIVADRDMQTSAKGIFAGGDCIKKNLRQVVTACGDGASAAASAQHYVEELKGESY
ncbi:MAG TPA: thioredoxin-disulfide reductase [Syntrophales bacterium]|nr:thioredoxin-disulfide reductase [Syntrophales bacterium]